MLTSEFEAVSEHGVFLEEFGVAGRSTLDLHDLGYEERNTAGPCDHHGLPHKSKSQQK